MFAVDFNHFQILRAIGKGAFGKVSSKKLEIIAIQLDSNIETRDSGCPTPVNSMRG